MDAPRVPGAPPTVLEATRDVLAVLRCHGRNAETWWKRTRAASERFDYWCSEEEVAEHVARARALAERARTVAVVYNNFQTQGVEAAAMFMRLAGLRWPPVNAERSPRVRVGSGAISSGAPPAVGRPGGSGCLGRRPW